MYKINFVVTVFILFPFFAHAATLSLSSSSNSYVVGDTFTVGVYVGSTDESMNAASATVSFPTDALEVVSVSKTGSIFSFWTEEPSFSNSVGKVTFEGVVLNPGFTGSRGTLLIITFKAKKASQLSLKFSSGSVFANDGLASQTLKEMYPRVITIRESLPAIETPAKTLIPESSSRSAGSLKIVSSTHPDQTKWYTNKNPEFSWVLSERVLEVRALIGTLSLGQPTIRYSPAIFSKKIENLADGTYYFSLQARTSSGWGTVSRYRVNIDTTPPNPFTITFPHGNKNIEQQLVALFNTTDVGSGISHYDIKIGNSDESLQIAPSAPSNQYIIPAQNPGTYNLSVTAVDTAGNTQSTTTQFVIEGIAIPTITFYPDVIVEGDSIKIRGTTYPDTRINLNISQGSELISEEYAKSNPLGEFTLVVSKRLESGTYTFTAHATNGKEVKSAETQPLSIFVESKSILVFGDSFFKYFAVVILSILALVVIIGTSVYVGFNVSRIAQKVKRKARDAERVSEESFRLLRKNYEMYVIEFKASQGKEKGNEGKVDFLKEFEKSLDTTESVVMKEIRDISDS